MTPDASTQDVSAPAATGVPVNLGPRPLHPRRGIHAPRPSLGARVPGSIRRTSTIDATRPGEITGDLVQYGVARDLWTHLDGTTEVLGTARVESRIDYADRYRLLELVTTPKRHALVAVVGRSVSAGFRAAMTLAVPDECEQATLLHLLLDDLPGAALVSGLAVGKAGAVVAPMPKNASLQIADLCAGFQRGGTIMIDVDAGGRPPLVTGPLATRITPDDDPDAWHELRTMGPHDMRRWRCLDVVPGEPGGPVHVEAYFRDSHCDELGIETVVHEYTVVVSVDPVNEVVLASTATAHSLPWVECIQAEASADRLAGRPLRGLRPDVREEFTGISTCTHLNDTMRSLEDLRALLPLLARHR
jgi:Protein of unknown function (DUF2889)